jgi:hypothetical protein
VHLTYGAWYARLLRRRAAGRGVPKRRPAGRPDQRSYRRFPDRVKVSVRCPARNDPFVFLACDFGDELEVGVVVQHDEVPRLSGSGHEAIHE